MNEEDTSVMRLDLPPGRQDHQKLMEHTICLANQGKAVFVTFRFG